MKKLIIIILLLIASPVFASNVIECDWNDPIVEGRVLRYLRSVNTPDYYGKQYIIQPNISHLTEVPMRYWKCEKDRTIIEMTAKEKQDLDTAMTPPQPKININQQTGCIEFMGKGELCSGGTMAGFGNTGLIIGGGIIAMIILFWKKLKEFILGLIKNNNN